MVFHNYNNQQAYGFTAVSSVFIPQCKPSEPDIMTNTVNAISHSRVVAVSEPAEKRRLPGVALLKKLHKSKQKKPLDMKVIERSINGIMGLL